MMKTFKFFQKNRLSLIDKWTQTGMLHGAKDPMLIARVAEMSSEALLNDTLVVLSLLIPLVVIIYKKFPLGEYDDNTLRESIMEIRRQVQNNIHILRELETESYNNIEAECEFVNLMCNQYLIEKNIITDRI